MKARSDVQVVIIKKETKLPLFLILKRFDKDKKEDHYRLVKGGIKKDEDKESSVIREMREEVGICPDNIESLCCYEYTANDVRHEVDVFLAFCGSLGEEKINVNSEEEGGFTIKEAIWMTGEEATKKLTFEEEKKLITLALSKLA